MQLPQCKAPVGFCWMKLPSDWSRPGNMLRRRRRLQLERFGHLIDWINLSRNTVGHMLADAGFPKSLFLRHCWPDRQGLVGTDAPYPPATSGGAPAVLSYCPVPVLCIFCRARRANAGAAPTGSTHEIFQTQASPAMLLFGHHHDQVPKAGTGYTTCRAGEVS